MFHFVCSYTLDRHIANAYLCAVKSSDLISTIKADGWYQVAKVGSHAQFKHPTKPGRVTVPHPKKDIPIGTLKSIEKQAQLKLR
jgi:predicted RNA binding protein YcfA (HicA-like mRNA interferase family)